MKHILKWSRTYKDRTLKLTVEECVALTTFLREMRLPTRFNHLRYEAESISHKLGEWEFEDTKPQQPSRAKIAAQQRARWAKVRQKAVI